MSWKLNQRFKWLRMKVEVEQGTKWDGSDSEFVEMIHRTISYMPKDLRSDMERFYIRGEGRERDGNGIFTKESALYYQNVKSGRAILSFFLNVVNGDAELALSLLKKANYRETLQSIK